MATHHTSAPLEYLRLNARHHRTCARHDLVEKSAQQADNLIMLKRRAIIVLCVLAGIGLESGIGMLTRAQRGVGQRSVLDTRSAGRCGVLRGDRTGLRALRLALDLPDRAGSGDRHDGAKRRNREPVAADGRVVVDSQRSVRCRGVHRIEDAPQFG